LTAFILISLLLLTYVMWVLQRRIWKKYPNIILPIFVGIFYYWSLAGAWLFIFDQSTHWGEKIGIHYHYLLEKMFMVQLDADYLIGIWILGTFIIALQGILLFLIKRIPVYTENKSEPQSINDHYFALISLFFLGFSIFIVQDVISYSLLLNESIYLNIRSPHIPYYSLHQLACWAMMVSLTLPLAMGLRDSIKLNVPFKRSIFYWIIFGICQFYLIFIGSRHEAFLCGLATLIFISYPHHQIKNHWKTYGCIVVVWILILFMNDPFRSLSPLVGRSLGITSFIRSEQSEKEAALFREERTFIAHHNVDISNQIIQKKNERDTTFIILQDTITIRIKDFEAQRKVDQEFIIVQGKRYKIPNPHISKAYQQSSTQEKLFRAITGIIFSNELFAGHFSIYGVIHYNIPTSFGISFKNLLFSFIPSFIQKDRPMDVYGYYSQQLNLPSDQGFTINHITAWYINFGLWGLFVGPIFLGLILLSPVLSPVRFWNLFPDTTPLFVSAMITCFGAMLIRSGPEGVKSILYEAICIPLIIIWSHQLFNNLRRRFIQ
jgi:hypothetical protein